MPSQTTKSILYRDMDLNLRMHPVTGNLIMKKNNDAVKQGVRNVCLTNHYERPYRPEFGCSIRDRLFDLIDQSTAQDIEEDVAIAFENIIQRAVLLDVKAIANADGNALRVNIIYRPINAKTPVETTLLLERAR